MTPEEKKKKDAERAKLYRQRNKEAINERRREAYENNREVLLERQKEYAAKTKDQKKEYDRQYREKNAEYDKLRKKEYREANRELRNQREQERKDIDPLYKLKHRIRNLVYHSIKKMGYNKNTQTAKILGCSFDEFKEHLEAKFTEGMSWDNQGQWHIDHIKPMALAMNEQEVYELNHYTNLQPLWASDNLSKGCKYEEAGLATTSEVLATSKTVKTSM